MVRKKLSRSIISLLILLFCIISIIILIGNKIIAQEKQTISDIETRIRALERTINQLYTFMIVIPSVAGAIVIILQLSTVLSQRADRRVVIRRDAREVKSADTVDKVMSSVNRLLEFQAAQAEQLAQQAQKFDPSQGIKAIFDQVNELRKTVTRYNLYSYHIEINDVSHRMKNMEDLFNLPDFKQSIGCHYIRGLSAHLQNRFQDANMYLDAVSQQIVTEEGQKQKDAFIEPISLYFRGVLQKNIGNFDESRRCFENALAKWPSGMREIRALVELAEVVALQKKYSDSEMMTKKAFEEIEHVFQDNVSKIRELTKEQESNLRKLKIRLWTIEGNYAYKKALKQNKGWDKAIELYNKALEIDKDDVFGNLSTGITQFKMNLNKESKEKLQNAYRLILSSDKIITHPEPRGRILFGGAAIIAARISGIVELQTLRDPKEIEVDVIREIEELRRINIRSKREFLVFSPLTKEMETLTEFRRHIANPHKFI